MRGGADTAELREVWVSIAASRFKVHARASHASTGHGAGIDLSLKTVQRQIQFDHIDSRFA